MAAVLLLLMILLSACSADNEQENLVRSASADRQFRYEIRIPEGMDKKPLVILSHGSGGLFSNYNWIIDELVVTGYAVAALNHPGNNAKDNTSEGVVRVWDRPGDISLLLDALQEHAVWSKRIDFARIGVAGHSSGGYTAIALGGALYDHEAMAAYCNGPERGPDCDLITEDVKVDFSDSGHSYKDARIRSILAMAPAVGPGVTRQSLAAIDVPVRIIATKDDELLSLKHHAYYYADHMPMSDLTILPKGGHFIFLECDVVTRIADWFITELDLCGSQSSVDRASIRGEIGRQVVDFFDSNIGEHPLNKPSKVDAVTGAPS